MIYFLVLVGEAAAIAFAIILPPSAGDTASLLAQISIKVFSRFLLFIAFISRVVFIAVINEIAITNLLCHELVQSTEIFLAKICPELLVICRNQIIVHQVTFCKFSCHLLERSSVKFLYLFYFLFELSYHLVDLGRLHIQMINMVAFDHCVISLLPIHLVQFVQLLVSLPEFLDHELLQADYIHNVKKCLYLIEN